MMNGAAAVQIFSYTYFFPIIQGCRVAILTEYDDRCYLFY